MRFNLIGWHQGAHIPDGHVRAWGTGQCVSAVAAIEAHMYTHYTHVYTHIHTYIHTYMYTQESC